MLVRRYGSQPRSLRPNPPSYACNHGCLLARKPAAMTERRWGCEPASELQLPPYGLWTMKSDHSMLPVMDHSITCRSSSFGASIIQPSRAVIRSHPRLIHPVSLGANTQSDELLLFLLFLRFSNPETRTPDVGRGAHTHTACMHGCLALQIGQFVMSKKRHRS